jgi:hypothetical protein
VVVEVCLVAGELMPAIPLIAPSYRSQSLNVDCQRLVNFYIEAVKAEAPGAKTAYAAYPCPGFTLFTTLATTPVRGMFSQNGRCFAVGGNMLYEVFANGTNAALGTMDIDAYPATLCSNGPAGHQLFVTSGNSGYVFDLNTSVFSHVLTGARMGAFLDGYFLALNADTSTLQWSALEDGTSWSGADVAQRNTAGDKWIAMAVAHRQILLAGSQSCEFWYDSGDALNPFQPVDGAFFEIGIAAPFSLSLLDNELTWVVGNQNGQGYVVRSVGNSAPARISDHAVEFGIQSYGTISDAVAFPYQDQGHPWYVLNFPTAGRSWSSDTQFWHERGYWDAPHLDYDAYRVQSHTFIFNAHLVGDRLTGAIYTMSVATATEVDGTGIRRQITAPIYLPTRNLVFHQALQIDLETGLGLDGVGQGTNPQVVMTLSNDSGHTYGNEHWASAGKIGQFSARVLYQQLGQARGYARAYTLVMSDPIPWRVAQGFVDVQEGTH